MGVDERKHLYYEMLSYWWGVVKKFRPECIIFTTVPHTVYDYLLYELARSLNIRTIMFRAAMPVDVKESHARHSFLNRMLLKMRAVSVALKEGTFLEQALLRVIKLFKENIRDEYVRVQSLPDYSQKFVYAEQSL